MFIGGFIGNFILRFVIFLFKIISSCVFVMMLQIPIGERNLEGWIEHTLKTSYLSKTLQDTVIAGQQKFRTKIGLSQVKKRVISTTNITNTYFNKDSQKDDYLNHIVTP